MAFVTRFASDTTGIGAPETTWNLFRVPEIDNILREKNIYSPVFYRMLELAPTLPATKQPRYNWVESDIPAITSTINHGGGYSSVATSIVVADGTVFRKGDAVRTMTHLETILVTNIVGNTLTITRGHQGSTPAIIFDAEILMVINYELGEGGEAPDARSKISDEKWNYIAAFARTFEITELQEATDMRYNVAKLSNETLEKAFSIRRDISNACIYGKRAKGLNHLSEVIYDTNGFYALATANSITVAEASLTWPVLYGTFEDAFTPTASSPRKVLICGPKVYRRIASILYDKTTFSKYIPELGQTVTRIILPSGNEIDMVKDPYTFSTTFANEGKGILVDSRHIGIKWMNNWQLQWKQNIQSNSAHTRKDEIYGACGFVLFHPSCHGSISLT